MQLRDLRKQFKWRHLRAKRKKKGLEEVQDRYSFLPPFLCQSSPSGIPCPIRKSDLLLAYPSSLKPTFYTAAAAAKSCQSCLTLCDSIDGSPPGSPVPGILQARTLEWVAISYFRDLPNPGIKPVSLTSSALAGGFFTTVPPRKHSRKRNY